MTKPRGGGTKPPAGAMAFQAAAIAAGVEQQGRAVGGLPAVDRIVMFRLLLPRGRALHISLCDGRHYMLTQVRLEGPCKWVVDSVGAECWCFSKPWEPEHWGGEDCSWLPTVAKIVFSCVLCIQAVSDSYLDVG